MQFLDPYLQIPIINDLIVCWETSKSFNKFTLLPIHLQTFLNEVPHCILLHYVNSVLQSSLAPFFGIIPHPKLDLVTKFSFSSTTDRMDLTFPLTAPVIVFNLQGNPVKSIVFSLYREDKENFKKVNQFQRSQVSLQEKKAFYFYHRQF